MIKNRRDYKWLQYSFTLNSTFDIFSFSPMCFVEQDYSGFAVILEIRAIPVFQKNLVTVPICLCRNFCPEAARGRGMPDNIGNENSSLYKKRCPVCSIQLHDGGQNTGILPPPLLYAQGRLRMTELVADDKG